MLARVLGVIMLLLSFVGFALIAGYQFIAADGHTPPTWLPMTKWELLIGSIGTGLSGVILWTISEVLFEVRKLSAKPAQAKGTVKRS